MRGYNLVVVWYCLGWGRSMSRGLRCCTVGCQIQFERRPLLVIVELELSEGNGGLRDFSAVASSLVEDLDLGSHVAMTHANEAM